LKWHLLWRLGPGMDCSFWIRWHKLRRHLATWQIPDRFGRALSPVPTRLSFRQCAYAFMTLQCLCLCYNCERDPYPRSWLENNHSTIYASYTVRLSKSEESWSINWAGTDPQ
jgi:hypothetical protein